MGKLAAYSSAGRLLGPAIGGVLAGYLAFKQLFLLTGSIIAVAAIFVAIYLEEPPRDPTARKSSFLAPFHVALRDWKLRVAIPGLLASMAAISMTMPIFPLFVEDLCGAGTDPKVVTGIGFAVVAGFTLLASVFLGKVTGRLGLKRVLVVSLALTAVALVLHPLARGIAPMLVLRALLLLLAESSSIGDSDGTLKSKYNFAHWSFRKLELFFRIFGFVCFLVFIYNSIMMLS